MTEHFTRATISATFYCAKCGCTTQHRIDDRRKGPCLECIARLEKQHTILTITDDGTQTSSVKPDSPKTEDERQQKLFS
jgi:hypothetical protein